MTFSRQKARRFIIHKVLHADDTPHRIALGVAIGVFIAITPTIGLQMILAFALAAMLRANTVVAVPTVWVSNPLTIVPIYAAGHQVGAALLGLGGQARLPADATKFPHSFVALFSDGWLQRIWTADFWLKLVGSVANVGAELWVGCLFVAFVVSVPTYFMVRRAVTGHRERRNARRQQRIHSRKLRRFTRMQSREPTT